MIQSGLSLYSLIIVGLILVAAFYYYERRRPSAKEAALLATLAALAGLSRVPMGGIPGIQPTTFMVIVCGNVLGPGAGFMIGALAAVVSNMFLGQGPWTPWQMLSWGMAGFSGGILKFFFHKSNRIIMTAVAFLWGFLFGWIMNSWHWITFVYPLTVQSFLTVQLASVWFDFVHALGNALFMLLAGPELIKILDRFRKRLSYIRIT